MYLFTKSKFIDISKRTNHQTIKSSTSLSFDTSYEMVSFAQEVGSRSTQQYLTYKNGQVRSMNHDTFIFKLKTISINYTKKSNLLHTLFNANSNLKH